MLNTADILRGKRHEARLILPVPANGRCREDKSVEPRTV